jgi:hypothetical protein
MPAVSNTFGAFALLLSLRTEFLSTVQNTSLAIQTHTVRFPRIMAAPLTRHRHRYIASWVDLQSIYLKSRYLELHNRLCFTLSCFFSLRYYFTKNIARINYKNIFFSTSLHISQRAALYKIRRSFRVASHEYTVDFT